MTQSTAADDGIAAPLRVTCIAADELAAAAMTQLVASVLPRAAVSAIDPSSVRTVPDTDCALLDTLSHPAAVLQTLRSLRARGFKAPAICVAADGLVDGCGDVERARLGITHLIEASAVTAQLPQAIRAATRLDAASLTSPSVAQTLKLLRQTQRLLAAGEIAMKMQHSLNNPLAALLAEAQLLQLENLTQEHQQAVERIIELSRRLIEVTRSLEGIGTR
ncbi:MAG: histidine kinase dimerization/phospho-acceptor domain-containing protein [Gemmatimonadaceae bacterium]